MSYKKLKLSIFLILIILIAAGGVGYYYFLLKPDSRTKNEQIKDTRYYLINNGYRLTGYETFLRDKPVIVTSPGTAFSINDVKFSDTEFYSYTLVLYENKKISNSFFVNSLAGKSYAAGKNSFIHPIDSNSLFSMVNFNFPFLNFKKEKIVPYLNSSMLIKVLYIMDKLKSGPRLSDAMRTKDSQMRYKRRGWSTVDISPHIIGIAVDISRYLGKDRKFVEDLSPELGLRFLQHGGRGNTHIHLQDQYLWRKASATGYPSGQYVKDVSDISDSLIAMSGSVIYESNEINNKDSAALADVKVYTKPGIGNYYFRHTFEKPSLLTLKFIDAYGNVAAEIQCGVFEQGKRAVNINCGFLPSGVYTVTAAVNRKQVSESFLACP